MKLGIIGSGKIGGTLAKLFVNAGYEVAISNSRGPNSLQHFVEHLGYNAKPSTVDGAAYFGDVIFIAIPFGGYRSLEPDIFLGKIVVDAMNYYPQRDSRIAELDSHETTSSELLAKHLNESRIVKAFNTIFYQHLANNGKKDAPVDERQAIFVAGDDANAKRVVSGLIEEIGFAPVDTGTLAEGGRRQQPGSPIYNQQITGKEAATVLRDQ